MWFVWDGQRRHGPLNENEICRRIVAGECSLQSWIREEEDSFYRPMTWMLRSWTSAKALNGGLQENVLLEATKIAAPLLSRSSHQNPPRPEEPVGYEHARSFDEPLPIADDGQSQSQLNGTLARKPEFPENLNELSNGKHLEFSIKDSLKSILSGKFSDLKLFSKSRIESPIDSDLDVQEDEQRPDPVETDAEDLAIELDSQRRRVRSPQPSSGNARAEVEYRSEAPSNSSSSDSQRYIESAVDEPEALPVALSRHLIGKNQMPKVASEGVVSLAEQKPRHRSKVRRVNPTAPRHMRQKKTLWASLSRSISQTFLDPFLLKVFAVSFLLTLTGLLAYILYKKQTATESPLIVAGAAALKSAEKTPDPTIEKIRAAVAKRNSRPEIVKQKKTQKQKPRTMRARAPVANRSAQDKSKKIDENLKKDVLSSQRALNAHLGSSAQGGFIVVGPLQLIQPPPSQCAPCEGRVRLPDGSTLVIRSVVSLPWRELRFQQSFYARGSLVKAKPYFLFLNKVSAQPKF